MLIVSPGKIAAKKGHLVEHTSELTDSQPVDGPGTSGGAVDASRLFRREGIVSDFDLRVDIARQVSDAIYGDEEVALDRKSVHSRGDHRVLRGSRTRHVRGRYKRKVSDADTLTLKGGTVTETVHGKVDFTAKVDYDLIMGGAYVNTIAGAYARMAGWVDFLVWGGWAEADAARVELSAVMLRSYVMYAHAAGLRFLGATTLVDEFTTRTENFGTHTSAIASSVNLGGPGSGTVMEV